MNRFLVLVFSLCASIGVIAQDIHFSQFYMSPLNLNPAMTGVTNNSQRLILNYRNQWAPALGANAYNTSSLSYDVRKPIASRDYFGIGGSLWGDVAGESNFGTFQAKLSGSYSKFLSGGYKNSNYLVIGTDIGFTQNRITPENLRWPQQHNGIGGWDGNAPSGEGPGVDDGTISNINYLDLSVGLLYFSVLDEFNNFYAGFSLSHINSPNVSFLNQDVSLYRKMTAHAGGELELSRIFSLLPGAIVLLQGPHREYNAGASLRFRMKDTAYGRQYVQFGLWYRLGNRVDGGLHSDAAIFSARLDNGNYGIGLSYDATVSEFRRAGVANGSFELSLNYYIKGEQKRRIYCPTF